MLQLHLGIATNYHPFAALGTKYAAAAIVASVSFSQLVGHVVILSGLERLDIETPKRLQFQIHLFTAADDATWASLGHNKLGATL